MISALSETLTYAIGLAISPFAITSAIVLLMGDRGRTKTAFFGLGWFVALSVITAIALVVVDNADDEFPEETADGIDIISMVFAALFFVLAAVTWLKRRSSHSDQEAADGESARKPSILDRLGSVGPLGCLGLGLAQGFIVIKNIPLGISAGAELGSEGLNSAEAVGAVAIFAFLASLGIVIPLVATIVGGDRSQHALARSRTWLDANMITIMLILFIALGLYYVYKAALT